MSTALYVLTDGTNSKIGISSNMDARLQAYRTHNPDFSVHAVKANLTSEVAKRIESVVKACFSHVPSKTGKEWFRIPADHMLRVVDFHMNLCFSGVAGKDPAVIAATKVPVPSGARDLLAEISDPRTKDNWPLKQRFSEIFAANFNIGMPSHKLPETALGSMSGLPVDYRQCDFRGATRHINANYVRMPADDHVQNFYRTVETKSGHHIALCVAHVSMPYPEPVSSLEEIKAEAAQCGLSVFQHDRWSWHSPGETSLLLYLQKTPVAERISAFEGSFRKWVIENSNTLTTETGFCREIEDICHDSSFPLDVTNWTDLYIRYLKKLGTYAGPGLGGRSGMRGWREGYTRLFSLWQERK